MRALAHRAPPILASLSLICCGGGEARGARPATGVEVPESVVSAAADAPVGVAAGAARSCALRDGSVWCWGGARGAPDEVLPAVGATRVAAAGAHVCATLVDGGVICFTHGPETAERVAGLADARALGVGPHHACAVDAGGRVQCWGSPVFGMLGRPAGASGSGEDPAPAQVVGLSDVVELALGSNHSCALTREGHVSCWGLGADPRSACTADEGRVTCSGPAAADAHRPREVAGLSDVRSIASHGLRTCALRRDGVVFCFRNIHHDSRGRWVLRRVARVEGGTRLTLGQGFGCVLARGSVLCFGEDDRGQRGDGEVRGSQSRDPTSVLGITEAADVAAGDRHACAVERSGAVSCWGANGHFQLGDGTGGFDGSPVLLAVPGVVALHGDAELLCARLSDGTVHCLGHNDHGQLGDGTLVTRWDFSPVVNLGGVAQLDVAGRHACAVTRRGDLVCWGDNRRLYLGPSHRPEPPSLSAPVRATWLAGIGRVATSLAGTCALTRGGRASCFGLPNGPRREPTHGPVEGVSRATDLDAGAEHFCATLRDGRVRCWGVGRDGELGVAPADAPSSGSVSVPGLGRAREVALGCAFSCALLRGGEVSCWGANDASQLGPATEAPASSRPVGIPGLGEAASIAAGCRHACARDRGGAIHCWGSNARGQLGAGNVAEAGEVVRFPVEGQLHVLEHATCVDEGGGALRCHGAVPGVAERADRDAPVAVSGLR